MGMGLDILTDLGKQTIVQENEAISLFQKTYLDWHYVGTKKDSPCAADGFLVKNNIIQGVVETKCRNLTLEKLEEYNFEWLVTMQKIIDCTKIAESLHVDFVGFLYLVPQKILMVKKIWDVKSGFVVDFQVTKSLTRATVNGGTANRANAYIKMNDATIIREKND
jgi:hypothetical protein